ncbi:MAG: hypothetical protein CMA28_00930 [Euryarchaeota archaeon]|nr:hypothetical protein [Euryarchaeota archaeon]
MRTTFGKEILTRKVVDTAGDLLGHLADFTVDLGTGNIVSILVVAESDIDPNELPWPTTEGLISIPVEEIATIGSVVELSR